MLLKFLTILLLFQYIYNFQLSVIHFNDFHARYEPTNGMGGFSKLFAQIEKLKRANSHSILLNAGDMLQGTFWHVIYNWNITQHFFNQLPLTATTLENHEFDDGVSSLAQFLQNFNSPVVVANLDTHLELQLSKLIKQSIIIENQDKKIGIIGVLTSTTQATSLVGKVIITDELQAVNREAVRLEKEVFTTILLSHCGYEADLELARKSEGKISLIVGGHTDTFLFSGDRIPGPDKPSGPYPTVVLNKKGQKVLIVQASAYSKYLGNLSIFFNDFGEISKWEGAPIFLGEDISADFRIDKELAELKKLVDLKSTQIIGRSNITLMKKPCREVECQLGNFVTDAMIFSNGQYNFCNNMTIALFHAGGMRADIEQGNITFKQLISTFPFQDTINSCTLLGHHLKEILENVMDNNHMKHPHLLQTSGLQIVYNTSKPEKSRIDFFKTCCKEAQTICKNLDLEKNYTVLLPSFLTNSNFNPTLKKYMKNVKIGDRDSNVYIKYLQSQSPISPKIENRIVIVE